MKTLERYIDQFLFVLPMICRLFITDITKRIWIIPMLIFSSGLVSCNWESELEIDDIEVPSRLVINSILVLEKDTNKIYYSNSKSLFSATNSREATKYVNSSQFWYADPKVYYLTDVETSLLKNGAQQTAIFTNLDDSITYYIDNQIKAGDQFTIEANQDGRKVSSSTMIPAQPQILSVDTMSFRLNTSSGSYYSYSDQMRLLVKIKSQPGIKNYYRIFVNTESTVRLDPEYAKYHDIPEVYTGVVSTLGSDDPAITNGNPKNNNNSDFSMTEFQQNYYNIFTDDLFKNDEYTLNVYTINPTSSSLPGYSYQFYADPKFILGYKVKTTILLQALSPELYQYLNSLQKFLYHYDDVIEPFRVYNNINGGIGIFGSINQLKYVVFEEEYTK